MINDFWWPLKFCTLGEWLAHLTLFPAILSLPILSFLPTASDLLLHLSGKVKSLSRVRLFATPWTVAYQAPLSMRFFRQEFWSGLPFPSPWDLPNPGIKPRSPTLQADTLPCEAPGKPLNGKLALKFSCIIIMYTC